MKTSKRVDSIIAIARIIVVLVFAIFMFNGCSVRADILNYQKDKQIIEAKNDSFIMFIKLTDIIIMDSNTGVLYVREKHASKRRVLYLYNFPYYGSRRNLSDL